MIAHAQRQDIGVFALVKEYAACRNRIQIGKGAPANDKGGGPGVWPAGGSIAFVLIFCFFCIKTKESHSDSGYSDK